MSDEKSAVLVVRPSGVQWRSIWRDIAITLAATVILAIVAIQTSARLWIGLLGLAVVAILVTVGVWRSRERLVVGAETVSYRKGFSAEIERPLRDVLAIALNEDRGIGVFAQPIGALCVYLRGGSKAWMLTARRFAVEDLEEVSRAIRPGLHVDMRGATPERAAELMKRLTKALDKG